MNTPASPAIGAHRAAATPIVIVGHVDHGKSTLIGRLLHDTGSLQEGKLAQIVESSRKRGLHIEWSFLLDSLQIERDQGVTVDSTRIPFHLGGREYVIVDAPGHRQFLRNMITGAADAEAAVLVVDAQEGAQEQTRRHAMLLRLIGIRHVIVLLNKSDLLGFDEARIAQAEADVRALLGRLEIAVEAVIPASARDGDNIAARSEKAPWYEGPTLTEALAQVPPPGSRAALPFRMPVQDVYRFDDVRYVAGRVERGAVRTGDRIVIGAQGQVATVVEISRWHAPESTVAGAGESVALRLEPDLVPDRGDLLFPADDAAAAPERAARIRTRLFWLRSEPLRVGESFTLRLSTAEHDVTVASIDAVVDLDTLMLNPGDSVPADGFAEVTLAAAHAVLFDPFQPGLSDGRGVLVDRFQRIVAGAPLIGAAALPDGARAIHPTASRIDAHARAKARGHRAAVFWLTGLPGSGKSTLARRAEEDLAAGGSAVTVLDGDTLRAGLCSDLGFSPEERRENIRRAAHVAKILAESGQAVIVALVSPLRADREMARQIVGESFHEIFVDTPLATCEARDPKGLYAAAKAGKIPEFTGVSAPYEAPDAPALVLADGDAAALAERLAAFIRREVAL
ncbi:adenylyl-sulfate kinase [Acidomonas methanolica]|uniref:Adenylyl-sulfate kinase n=2 Tax=Acidomonas methanolica TaxID=437 RepID=A0A023D336_ACIMT|nr:adenylyl-sulfate kinase [Acidomonas methanolica]MBU2654097.1 adenylyl-sulfate kinase [Acidomonas methanolica]TCS30674.1 bifunctional enzyme CysN/CysC [Acidomonas methanolica]GAJ28196.1 sulfate adenylyltransferase subunit 1/adenylylsulfate kinase [Acidomonas methanolica NBRC 104435]GEK98938.1 adenylyl-sulfate kinase [Acidomonas methanolica NBRC 104435]